MRKNYNIPLNDNSSMDMVCPPQSNFMPSFLVGNNLNNNQNDSIYLNQSKLPQNSMQMFTSFETKPRPTNIKRHESHHESVRKTGPPISALRCRSPKSSYMKNYSIQKDTNANNVYANTMVNGNTINLNSSRLMNKPYESMINKNSNTIKDSSSYSRFLNRSINAADTENEYENWVTVFGFTPNDAKYVLSYFTEIGTINEHKISNTCNWMHLHYVSKMHAVAALNKNGRILNLNVMIGVKPCDDKIVDIPMTNRLKDSSFIRSDNLNNSRLLFNEEPIRSPSPNTEMTTTTTTTNDRLNASFLNGTMRSLAASSNHFSPANEEVKPRGGMLSRAMSVMFGKK